MPWLLLVGMMTVTGTRKPVWRAFELLMDAGTERLEVTGSELSPVVTNSTVSVLATKGGKGAGPMGLQMFVANYRRLLSVESYSCDHVTHQCVADQRGDYTDEGACNADCKTGRMTQGSSGHDLGTPGHPWPPDAHTVTVAVGHAAGVVATTAAVLRRIDSTHANAFAEWSGPMRNVTYPSKLQVDRLNNVIMLVEERLKVHKVSDTLVTLTFTMPAETSAAHIAL